MPAWGLRPMKARAFTLDIDARRTFGGNGFMMGFPVQRYLRGDDAVFFRMGSAGLQSVPPLQTPGPAPQLAPPVTHPTRSRTRTDSPRPNPEGGCTIFPQAGTVPVWPSTPGVGYGVAREACVG